MPCREVPLPIPLTRLTAFPWTQEAYWCGSAEDRNGDDHPAKYRTFQFKVHYRGDALRGCPVRMPRGDGPWMSNGMRTLMPPVPLSMPLLLPLLPLLLPQPLPLEKQAEAYRTSEAARCDNCVPVVVPRVQCSVAACLEGRGVSISKCLPQVHRLLPQAAAEADTAEELPQAVVGQVRT